MSPQQILTTVMMCIIVNQSTDHAKPHFDLFLPQHQCQRKCFLEHKLKKALPGTLMQATLSARLLSAMAF